MQRFKQTLDTALRSLIITDSETGNKLTIQQNASFSWLEKEECDTLVDFANDLAGDMESGVLALELFGDSSISFTKDNFPKLTGGVYLRDCVIANPELHNVTMRYVMAPSSDKFSISHSTVEGFEWPHDGGLTLSHCFINDKYSDIRERCSMQMNEWFMNQRVEGEMW